MKYYLNDQITNLFQISYPRIISDPFCGMNTISFAMHYIIQFIVKKGFLRRFNYIRIEKDIKQ